MELTKQTLGECYVVAAGSVLTVALLGHAVVALEQGPLAVALVGGGIDVALAADHQSQEPTDIVPHIEDRVRAVETAYPDAAVETTLPDRALVYGDWLVGTVLDNVIENVMVHADETPHLQIDVEQNWETVTVRLADDCPRIPDNERPMFERGVETPLNHSTGVGLWLVQSIMESYDGDVRLGDSDAGGNEVELVFSAAASDTVTPFSDRLRQTRR